MHRLDTDELHDAGPVSRERTDRESPEDVVIESGETAEFRGQRARIFRWDDTEETVRTDRPDPKGWISVISRQPAAHHKAGTGEGRIGSASGRHVDGFVRDDVHAPCHQSQDESEDATPTYPTSTNPASEAPSDAGADGHDEANEHLRASFFPPPHGRIGWVRE